MRTQAVADYTFLYMREAHLTQSMSENVKITLAETMSQNFRHIVISTHKNVEMSLAETMSKMCVCVCVCVCACVSGSCV